MKKFLMLLLVLFASGVFAAEVPDSLLTETQRQKLQLIDTKAKVETAKGYLGLGKEIGIAVNDAMSAITDQGNRFANSDLGRFVKWIIIYKLFKNLVLAILTIILTWIFFAGFNVWMFFTYRRDAVAHLNNYDREKALDSVYWAFVLSSIATIITTFVAICNV